MVAAKPSTEEKKQALDLVCESQTFARADRLRGLLQFICSAEMEGRQDSLNEYVIGVEALGRPNGYSPGEDSCVRSRVYELRQRLEKFYGTEAPDAPLRIDVPKGSYVPRYVRTVSRPAELPLPLKLLPESTSEETPAHARPIQSGRAATWQLAAAFVIGVVVTYSVLAFQGEPKKEVTRAGQVDSSGLWTSDLTSIWQPFLDPGTAVLVSFQSRLFLTAGPVVIRDSKIDSYAGIESSDPIMRAKALFKVPQLYENRNYTDFGAANACLLLGRLLGVRQPNIWAKRSSEVNWEDLGSNNVIVLGKPNADPDIARLLPAEHFVIDGANVRNLQPTAGEPSGWMDDGKPWDRSNNWSRKHGLITMIPGPQRGRWILSLAGSGSEHLWALAHFVTSPESAKQLVGKLRQPTGDLPSSWQAVVRADFKAQSPVKVEYLTHRNLDVRSSASH